DLGVIVNSLTVTGVDGDWNDLLAGGAGADVIFGAGGDDSIFGGTLLVSGQTTITDLDKQDFIDGGDGNDTIFADDAHSAAVTSFPGANIGDTVWFDAADEHGVRNGVRDPGEIGVANVQVQLFDTTNKLIADTTTDSAGAFQFVGLPAGDYYLKFALPTGLTFIDPYQGDKAVDSDVDPLTGKTAVFHMSSGQIDLTR